MASYQFDEVIDKNHKSGANKERFSKILYKLQHCLNAHFEQNQPSNLFHVLLNTLPIDYASQSMGKKDSNQKDYGKFLTIESAVALEQNPVYTCIKKVLKEQKAL